MKYRVADLLTEHKNNDKDVFREKLSGKIADVIKWDGKEEIKYGDRQGRVSKILLLHNVITMQKQKNETARFPFSYYIELGKYDIEHIHPKNPQLPDSTDRKVWLDENKVNILDAGLKTKIDAFSEYGADDKFQILFNEIEEYFASGIDVDDLSNLTLLDAHTNRSYHNDFFLDKRIKILREDQEGTFIPVCAKRVFQKYYTEKPLNMTFWNEDDREAYLEDIKTVLSDYLTKE
jgi:hypothetical protein